MTYWSLHTHTRYSAADGMSNIKALGTQAQHLGYPALGCTDHGTVAALVQHYNMCKKLGIKPAPGVELYFTVNAEAKEKRSMHLTVAAFTEEGYRNLVTLATLAHENFYRRPRVDVADLAQLHEAGKTTGLLMATGCRSGPVVRALLERDLDAAVRVAGNLARYFDRTYIEIMNHGFSSDGHSDDEICASLVEIADRTGLPIIVTGDSHYVLATDQPRHDAMKELLTWSENPEDGHFSGSGYHLVDEHWLSGFLEPAVLARGIDSLNELAETLSVRIPELDTFTLKVPDVTLGGDPDKELETRTIEAITSRTDVNTNEHFDRMFDELAVIKATDFAGYILMVLMITDMMQARKIWFHARGSAAGSFVLYLNGITQVDPVTWGIRMDRFLSGDRATPPDIDLDIQSDRRKEVVDWVKDHFAVRPVSTYSQYRLDENAEEQSGSLKAAYFTTLRKRGIYVAKDARIPQDDWDMLVDLSQAQLVQHTGTNAAGFIVASTEHELSIFPLIRVGSNEDLRTAYDKDDAELLGYPKVDLLGLTMLYAMSISCTFIAPEDPIAYWRSIPLDDSDAMDRAGSGHTKGMFQLEGYSQRTGLEELNPTKTEDIVTAQALFRPGVSKEFLGTYMRRRKGTEAVPPAHADIANELAPTFGVAVFQEQVVGVLREIGMQPAALTGMLKAVKASGKAGLAKAKEAVAEALPAIIELAQSRGWSNDDVVWLEAALTDYGAGYSFGKAHSVTYGLFAYNTAYLSVHEPLAFWTGVLIAYTGYKNVKKVDMELTYLREARNFGLKIRSPHINDSHVDYYPEDPETNTIRKGLISIPNVGRQAAVEITAQRANGGKFASLRDLGQRCLPSKVTGAKELALGKAPEELGPTTVIHSLHTAGALKGLEPTSDKDQPRRAAGKTRVSPGKH